MAARSSLVNHSPLRIRLSTKTTVFPVPRSEAVESRRSSRWSQPYDFSVDRFEQPIDERRRRHLPRPRGEQHRPDQTTRSSSATALRQQDTFDVGAGFYIVNRGALVTISDSDIHDNTSPGSGGGISFSGSLTIERRRLSTIPPEVRGGGIQFRSSNLGGLTLVDSKVLNNDRQ